MTAAREGVRYAVADGVATVTLARPERLNAVDLATGRRYNELLRRADSDPEVRVVIVTGEGRAFCSGADLSAMDGSSGAPPEERLPEDGLRPELAMLIRKPVVAAVRGPAIGVGLVLALYADVRIVADDAVLGFGFTRLGLVAEYGTAWLLPRLIGSSRATELLLSSRRFDGKEALALGLAHRTCPAEEMDRVAREYADELASWCSPAALAAVKAQLRDGYGPGLRQALEESRALMLATLGTPELAEGFAAQADRRAPSFPALPREAD